MAGARVESIEALAVFRVALVKFQETASSALGDAEADVQRTISWLENDQYSHWNTQIRHRQENVARAKEALRQKQIFKDSSGRTPSAVEEQKMVAKAMHQLAEAEQKLAAVKQWAKRLEKEMLLYKGQVQRFVTAVSSDVPAAIGHMGALIQTLQEYAAIGPAKEVELDPSLAAYFSQGGGASMSRGTAPIVARKPYANLRGLAPSIEARVGAAAVPAPAQWTIAPLSDESVRLIGDLKATWATPGEGEKVVIAKGTDASDKLFLLRAATDAANDSGWYVGKTDAGEAELQSILVSDLLKGRPDWRQLLALPPGTLVVIDRSGIAAMLSDKDESPWTPPPPPK
jgi:hypothetical protein